MKLKFTKTKDDHIKVETGGGFYVGSFIYAGDMWHLDLMRTQVSLLDPQQLQELSMKSNMLNSNLPEGQHLKISFYSLYDRGIKIHPIEIMNELGVRFSRAVPQYPDQYWFIGCRNVPEDLPNYITVINDETIYRYEYSTKNT